ncbi:hypothetical protein SAMN05192559_101848 [Halobacillus karajensis]|uniref:Uncharacterized protein n=1 Tax=Halobacillus karajensis TaxID=195088 RepID=A0A059NXD0_9BACI|nr:hypothetical protein [Halobacillus karajensis]CDQ18540.1 hypothetical protein BN982_00813 [Halobacillus karajensis]CDQ23388.1 hypothetical protein BN983_01615 [Halobacillus karajensis]CDQ26870.1 hypothetical protein BN981_01095 [Halobacillus karajensis]SEH50176.1 hypothetical protein SAMN05192559_101848 [Halobacillus karajensis]
MNDLTVEEFNQLLQKWHGEKIRIMKHEIRDEDTITMNLQEISYDTNTRRLDEYTPMHALYLHGQGQTETDAQSAQPLPSPYYEIPLEDSTRYQYLNDRFKIETERGTYTIEKET